MSTETKYGYLAPLTEKSRKSAVHYAKEWFGSTDAKRIGVMYVIFALFMGALGALLSVFIRAELLHAGPDFMGPDFYSTLPGMHASLMIFFFVIPIYTGLGNFIIPIQIGAPDMAFPKLNLVAFWILPASGMMLLSSYVFNAPGFGWTAYPPISTSAFSPSIGADLWNVSVILAGVSSTMAAVNFLATIFNMRCKNMSFFQLSLFTWAIIVTSLLILAATPVLSSALIMLQLERTFPGAFHFFSPAQGGDPILYQHLFWFYSHPAVYIMILPGFGIISEVLPTFSRKPIFGYSVMTWSLVAISVLGFLVWAHHMFTTGIALRVRVGFMFLSMIIAVPTGIKIFSWLATIWNGSLKFDTPMLFGLGFLSMFTLGGLSGVVIAAVPIDIQLHDTYYIVAHIHYVLVAGSVMTIFAGLYYWFPKLTGKTYHETLGKVHFWGTAIFINVTFFGMHYLGMKGMPRRYFDYDPQFEALNFISSIGAFALVAIQFVWLFNMLWSLKYGKVVGRNPWKDGTNLEWYTTSPPQHHNFPEAPVWTPIDRSHGHNTGGPKRDADQLTEPLPAE